MNVDPSATSIYISNHQSFLDIPATFGAIPVNLHFVAKQEIRKMPFIGWYMMATGMIFIDRSNREKSMQSLKKAGELIRKGKNVIMFPEGTRSRTGEIRRFKKGGFLLARESGVALVPVYVKNTGNVWPANKFLFIPGKIEVRIGKPIPPSEFDGMRLEDMAEKVRQAVQALA